MLNDHDFNAESYVTNEQMCIPISGSQGCNQACIGTVSVSGFQSDTSVCRRGIIICSRMLNNIHVGRRGAHNSNNSISGSQSRTDHFALKNKSNRYFTNHKHNKDLPSTLFWVHFIYFLNIVLNYKIALSNSILYKF